MRLDYALQMYQPLHAQLPTIGRTHMITLNRKRERTKKNSGVSDRVMVLVTIFIRFLQGNEKKKEMV